MFESLTESRSTSFLGATTLINNRKNIIQGDHHWMNLQDLVSIILHSILIIFKYLNKAS